MHRCFITAELQHSEVPLIFVFFFLIYRNESSHGSFLIRAYASSCRAGFTRCRCATRANLVFTCAHVNDGRGWTRVSSFFSAVRVRELAFPGLTWGNSSDVNGRQSVTLCRAAPSRAGRRVASFCLFFEESGAQHVAAACKWHMYTRHSPCISLLSSFPSDVHAGYVHLIHADRSCGTTASIPAKKARILRQYKLDLRENNHGNLVGTACDGFTRRSLPEIRGSSEGRVLLRLKFLGDRSFFYFFFLFFFSQIRSGMVHCFFSDCYAMESLWKPWISWNA